MNIRKCGGESRSDVGRKTTTATPVNPPPGGVSCRGVELRRVASLCMGTAAVGYLTLHISLCLVGLAQLSERGIFEVSRGAPGVFL
jgi:hypothetical protein